MIEDKGFFTPREIVSQLDRFIIGQSDAKRAVAIALRSRWRRQQLDDQMREEVLPKNILMIGPTGVGKTEIARRLAKLVDAPFIKVEATKFTEVGYVGRDVESIIRDLLDIAINQMKIQHRKSVNVKAEKAMYDRILDVLVGDQASDETRSSFKSKLISGDMDSTEIEIEVEDKQSNSMPSFDIPGMPGAQMGMISLGDILGKGMGAPMAKRKMEIEKAKKIVLDEEADKLLDNDKVLEQAIKSVEQDSIVFIDEFDKITARSDKRGGDVSREGVQRDLLPLLEGTTVMTKHGAVKTDHILFITSGAFHYAKPSDLLPEIQGRLPNRVELRPLTEDDFRRILKEPENSLIKQYIALLKTEGIELSFPEDVIDELAKLTVEINSNVENIGARRLQTVLEKLLEEISFDACDIKDKKITITKQMVTDKIGDLAQNKDLSKFIL